MDQLEQRVNEFFINAKKNKPEWREEQMEIIKKVKNRCYAPQLIQVIQNVFWIILILTGLFVLVGTPNVKTFSSLNKRDIMKVKRH